MNGTIYIIMLETPLGNERHRAAFYIGWAKNVEARFAHHCAGTAGVAFTGAAVERGIKMTIVWTEPGTKTRERQIKNRKNTRGYLVSKGVDLANVKFI